ncbi:hypothetical protein C8Q80DRAFT_1215316 [Daedaleopsis nitida]|nr:hypothetical protein C8Q80DRAFT_1215316 [Daedaleopsis nitida]
MPTSTRAREAAEQRNLRARPPGEDKLPNTSKPTFKAKKPTSTAKKPASSRKPASMKKREAVKEDKEESHAAVGEKRDAAEDKGEQDESAPAHKKLKTEAEEEGDKDDKTETHDKGENAYQTGTIERGHIYFFYRPKVQLEEAQSLDDVQRFYMLLVPRPPQFASSSDAPAAQAKNDEDQEMNLVEAGADAVPAKEPLGRSKKQFRLIVVGKKGLPDSEAGGRKQVFWASVSTVGEDLKKLEEGLGGSTYETKTRGTRHQGPARLAARGAYAIVNNEAKTPSQRETHLGYYLSHPSREHMGDVQETLGIHQASSFVLQVKNPLAPNSGPGQGLPKANRADYPEDIMEGVFGKGGHRGRGSYGLRFAACERKEMLDYEGAELLFIAARSGEQGLEQSLGEGRGQALEEVEKSESNESMEQVMKELAMDESEIPPNPLEGEWA